MSLYNASQVFVAPSILAADISRLGEDVSSVVQAGADWLHIDVMDGSFVPPITFGANVVGAIKQQVPTFLDVHLMIREPERHFKSFCDAGANRLIVHQETCPHLHRSLEEIKRLGLSNGVALNPGTPVEMIFDVLDVTDLVLIMTVNPGWGGQPFIHSSLDKICALKQHIDRRGLSTLIEVDGGITRETAAQCRASGARALVAGSYIFGAHDRREAIKSLRV